MRIRAYTSVAYHNCIHSLKSCAKNLRAYIYIYIFVFDEMRDFIQANVETNVKQNEVLSKRAITGVTYLAALRHAQGAYLIALRCRELCSAV
jgi:hypothetical protein